MKTPKEWLKENDYGTSIDWHDIEICKGMRLYAQYYASQFQPLTTERIIEILNKRDKIFFSETDISGNNEIAEIIVDEILSELKQPVNEREAKFKELYEGMKGLIKLYGNILSDHAVFLKIHGVEETEGNIKLGEMMRQQISELEKELNLK